MRVVAGILGGRKFDGPEGYDTRPTTDRVREAVFNSLNSLDVIRDARVADLFAGSGGMGIEAISRGAAHCVFIEKNRATLRVLRSNLNSLDLDDQTSVIAGDALALAGSVDVDVVIADPPYDFEDWPALLAKITADFIVTEAAKEVEPPPGWETIRARRYGRTWVTFLQKVHVDDEAPS